MAVERLRSLPRPHLFTAEEYLAFEERSEFKHEFIDGVIYDWGEPEAHERGNNNVITPYPPPHRFTVEEYLAFEERSEFKHEFLDGVIYELTGGTLHHSRIKVNIIRTLLSQLDDSRYEILNSDMRVGIRDGRYIYPDLCVVSGAAQLTDSNTTLLNPALAVEVASPSSITYDRETKLDYYRSLPSIQAYLVIDQHRVHVDCHTRVESAWLWQAFANLDDVISLEAIGCRLSVAQVYRGINSSEL